VTLPHLHLAWDPTAPVPLGWPHGALGTLLLFCVPLGLGVPSGVLLAAHDGMGPVATTGLYVVSDVLLAFVFEAVLRALRARARRVPRLDRVRRALPIALARILPPGRFAGSLGIVLTGFGIGMPFGRVIATGTGYGLVAAWALAITGDVLYFLTGLVSTLWFGGMVGDQRVAALGGIVVMVVVTVALHRLLRVRTG
jgi:hypothetical protein